MSEVLKSPLFLLRWLNASVMRWPAATIIVNLFYSIAIRIKNGVRLMDVETTIPGGSIYVILFALLWGLIFTRLTPPLSQRSDIDDAGLLGRGIYGVFCFIMFSNAGSGLSRLILLFCAAESVINILITRKSAHKKKEKSEGEILINMVAEGKMEVKNMLRREMRAMCEVAKDYDTLAVLDEADAHEDELADACLKKLEETEGIYVLPKEKDAKGRTFTKLRCNGEEIKSNGVIVTARGVFSLNIIYDDIKLKKESEEMFRVERPNGQPINVKPYISEIFEKYKFLANVTDFKYSLINILVAYQKEDVVDMITFHKMPVVIIDFNNLVDFVKRVSEKTGNYGPEEAKEIYELIEKHVVKEGAAK